MRTVLRSLGTVVLAGSGHNGNQVAIAMDHRIKGGSGVDGPSTRQKSPGQVRRSGCGPGDAGIQMKQPNRFGGSDSESLRR